MKWLTLEQIKANSRIESSEEDSLLARYGMAAEQCILRLLNRSWEDVCENFGREDIEGPLTIAGLLLADHLYKHRGPTENVQAYMIPYSIDMWIKPYMKLADNESANTNTQKYGRHCNL